MQTFTYDAIGNPLTYKNGWQLSWQNGRQLATVEQENGSVSYTYDENGIRQTKTMGEKVVTFRTEGSQILSQDQIPLHLRLGDANGDGILDTSDLALLRKALAGVPIGENQKERLDLNRDGTLTTDDLTQFKRIQAGLSEAPNEWLDQSGVLGFLYGASGEPLGFTIGDPDVFGGATYWYITNLQGDVIGLLDEDGNRIANYAYDAWGSLLSLTDASGNAITDTTHPANLNPLRYRGYYYDSETGFYYLNSRYYDPEVGRFINADGEISDVGGEILGYNLFTYCMNNPVNMSDETGAWPSWAKKVVAAVAVVAVVAAVAAITVATAGAGTVVAVIAVGAAKGAAIGMASGAAIGAASGAVKHRLSAGSWSGAGKAALNGMGDGALSGAVTGAITGAAGSAVKVSQAAKAWDGGTFKSGYQSMKYHYNKHVVSEGLTKGNSVLEYTRDAVSFANRNSSVLKYTYNYNYGNASWNLTYSTGRGGMFTSTGKILTFWYR